MITVTIHLSEPKHPDALLVGFETHVPLSTHSSSGRAWAVKMTGQKTGNIVMASMTPEWYDMFCGWIRSDGHAGKLRDFHKCDLQRW